MTCLCETIQKDYSNTINDSILLQKSCMTLDFSECSCAATLLHSEKIGLQNRANAFGQMIRGLFHAFTGLLKPIIVRS